MITKRLKQLDINHPLAKKGINYLVKNETHIHIIDLYFDKLYPGYNIQFIPDVHNGKCSFSEFTFLYSQNFNLSTENNLYTLDTTSLNEILKFKSTFSKDLGIYTRINLTNLPDLIITYYKIDSLPEYYLNTHFMIRNYDKFSYVFKSLPDNIKNKNLLGIVLTIKYQENVIVDNISIICEDNKIIDIDMYNCNFLGYNFVDETVGYLIPLTTNLSDIFWCIKNNDNFELKTQIENKQIVNLELFKIFNNKYSIKGIRCNNKPIKDQIISFSGIYLENQIQ